MPSKPSSPGIASYLWLCLFLFFLLLFWGATRAQEALGVRVMFLFLSVSSLGRILRGGRTHRNLPSRLVLQLCLSFLYDLGGTLPTLTSSRHRRPLSPQHPRPVPRLGRWLGMGGCWRGGRWWGLGWWRKPENRPLWHVADWGFRVKEDE